MLKERGERETKTAQRKSIIMSFTSYVMNNLTFILAIFIAITILISTLVARYEPDADFVWVTAMVMGLISCAVLVFVKLPNRNQVLETLKRK